MPSAILWTRTNVALQCTPPRLMLERCEQAVKAVLWHCDMLPVCAALTGMPLQLPKREPQRCATRHNRALLARFLPMTEGWAAGINDQVVTASRCELKISSLFRTGTRS